MITRIQLSFVIGAAAMLGLQHQKFGRMLHVFSDGTSKYMPVATGIRYSYDEVEISTDGSPHFAHGVQNGECAWESNLLRKALELQGSH